MPPPSKNIKQGYHLNQFLELPEKYGVYPVNRLPFKEGQVEKKYGTAISGIKSLRKKAENKISKGEREELWLRWFKIECHKALREIYGEQVMDTIYKRGESNTGGPTPQQYFEEILGSSHIFAVSDYSKNADPILTYSGKSIRERAEYKSQNLSDSIATIQRVIDSGYPVYLHINWVRTMFDVGNRLGKTPRIPVLDSLGGPHAVQIVGYNDKGFLILNSWGSFLGDGGMYKIDYGYLDGNLGRFAYYTKG